MRNMLRRIADWINAASLCQCLLALAVTAAVTMVCMQYGEIIFPAIILGLLIWLYCFNPVEARERKRWEAESYLGGCLHELWGFWQYFCANNAGLPLEPFLSESEFAQNTFWEKMPTGLMLRVTVQKDYRAVCNESWLQTIPHSINRYIAEYLRMLQKPTHRLCFLDWFDTGNAVVVVFALFDTEASRQMFMASRKPKPKPQQPPAPIDEDF